MPRFVTGLRFLTGGLDAAVDTKPLYPRLNKTVKRSQSLGCHGIAPVPYLYLGTLSHMLSAGPAYKSNGKTVEKWLGLLPISPLKSAEAATLFPPEDV